MNVVNVLLKTLRLGRLPGDVLYRFVGDVKLYQDRKRDGKGPLTDLGLPPRFAIRRRMVDALVAAYKQDYDRWYILAHSLGSVVAFNGLMETEHALPNYLKESVWRDLLGDLLRTDPNANPKHVSSMMPRRPLWIENDRQVLDRAKLFGRLRGFVTYGSPLDKFAHLWPQIVNVNKDNGVFPARFEWINVFDYTDPVGARLDAFKGAFGKESKPNNLAYKAHPLLLWSHTRYLKRKRRRSKSTFARLLVKWMLCGNPFETPDSTKRGLGTNWYRSRRMPILWQSIMWVTVALLPLGGIATVLEFLFFECDSCSVIGASVAWGVCVLLCALMVVGAAASIVFVAGLVRRRIENLLDCRVKPHEIKRRAAGIGFLLVLLLAVGLRAHAELTVVCITDDVCMIRSKWPAGNVGVLRTGEGAVVVDTMTAWWHGAAVLGKAKEITGRMSRS